MSTGAEEKNARSATEIDRRIGLRIRARRLELGMSQEKLAASIDVSFQQVQKYEKGANRVAASTLFHILSALEMTPTQLFAGIDNREPGQLEQVSDSEALALLKAFSTLKSPEHKKAALDAVRALSGKRASAD